MEYSNLTRRELQYLAKELKVCRANASSETIVQELQAFEAFDPDMNRQHIQDILEFMPEEAKLKTPRATPRQGVRRSARKSCSTMKIPAIQSSLLDAAIPEETQPSSPLARRLSYDDDEKVSEAQISTLLKTNANEQIQPDHEPAVNESNVSPVEEPELNADTDVSTPSDIMKETPVEEIVPETTPSPVKIEHQDEIEPEATEEATGVALSPAKAQQAPENVQEEMEIVKLAAASPIPAQVDAEVAMEMEEAKPAVVESPAEENQTVNAVAPLQVQAPDAMETKVIDTPSRMTIRSQPEDSSSSEEEESDAASSDDEDDPSEAEKSDAMDIVHPVPPSSVDTSSFNEVAALVDSMDELSFMSSTDRVRCNLTGHEMKIDKGIIASHLMGKKFLKAQKFLQTQKLLDEFKPMFVAHADSNRPDLITCAVTGVDLVCTKKAIEKHIRGANYQKLYPQWKAQQE